VLQPLKDREIFRLNETGDSANDNEDITIANMGKNNGGTNNWNYVKETYRGEDYVIPGGIIGTLFKRGHSTLWTSQIVYPPQIVRRLDKHFAKVGEIRLSSGY
jgi:hypothetical protein